MFYNDKKSSFDKLRNKYGTVSILHQNIQKLGMEIIKGGNPEILDEIFRIRMGAFMSFDKERFFISLQ